MGWLTLTWFGEMADPQGVAGSSRQTVACGQTCPDTQLFILGPGSYYTIHRELHGVSHV